MPDENYSYRHAVRDIDGVGLHMACAKIPGAAITYFPEEDGPSVSGTSFEAICGIDTDGFGTISLCLVDEVRIQFQVPLQEVEELIAEAKRCAAERK